MFVHPLKRILNIYIFNCVYIFNADLKTYVQELTCLRMRQLACWAGLVLFSRHKRLFDIFKVVGKPFDISHLIWPKTKKKKKKKWALTHLGETDIYIHSYICTHTHTYRFTHTCTHTSIHTYTHIHAHTHIHTYTHTHTHTYTHINSPRECVCV